jgi:hypothetical protein
MAAPMDPDGFRALTTRLREEDRHDELKSVLVEVGRASPPSARCSHAATCRRSTAGSRGGADVR